MAGTDDLLTASQDRSADCRARATAKADKLGTAAADRRVDCRATAAVDADNLAATTVDRRAYGCCVVGLLEAPGVDDGPNRRTALVYVLGAVGIEHCRNRGAGAINVLDGVIKYRVARSAATYDLPGTASFAHRAADGGAGKFDDLFAGADNLRAAGEAVDLLVPGRDVRTEVGAA